MKTYILRENKSGKYFYVEFSMYNSIEYVTLVDKKKATMFQPTAHILKAENGFFNVGKARYSAFVLWFAYFNAFYGATMGGKGIEVTDVSAEEFDAPEQPLIPLPQAMRIKEEIEIWLKPAKE